MPATSANSAPPLSRPLCAFHELFTTGRYCHASLPLVPSSVTRLSRPGDNQHRNQQQSSAYLYLYIPFSPTPFLVLIRGWEDISWGAYWLGFASCHYQLLETTRQCSIGIRKIYAWKKYRDVFYSAVFLIMTDSSLFSASLVLSSPLKFLIRKPPLASRGIDTLTPSPSLSFPISLFSDFCNTNLCASFCRRLFQYMHSVHRFASLT
jgi:hypothetical protein